MSVIAKNVIVGIGDFKIDSVSVGSTRGGVTVTKEVEVYEKMIDQQLNPVGLSKVREVYRVSTEFAESDLDRIKLLWDIPNSVEDNVATKTLSWGTTSTVTYKALTFYGKSPEGLDREFHCYKTFISEVGDSVLAKDEMIVIPITFTVYADTDKPTGKQLGYITDTITA